MPENFMTYIVFGSAHLVLDPSRLGLTWIRVVLTLRRHISWYDVVGSARHLNQLTVVFLGLNVSM